MKKNDIKITDIDNKKVKLIVCDVVYDEIKDQIPEDWEVVKFEKSLHENSKKLREELQKEINKSQDFDIIVLGYGLCGKGVEGLVSDNAVMVIPKCEDCISMFLGSDEERKKQLEINPGTYFLTRGYIGDSDDLLISTFSEVKDRYDEETWEWIKREMLKNYNRLAYIETGNYDSSQAKEIAKRQASKYNLIFEEIKGSNKLLSKITRGNWDGEFLVIEPGTKVAMEMFLNLAESNN